MPRAPDWKLTQEEYLNTRVRWSSMAVAFRSGFPLDAGRKMLRLNIRGKKILQRSYLREKWAHIYHHRAEVRWAMFKKRPVPQRVLEDYPEVVREFGKVKRNPVTPRLTLQDIATLERIWWEGPLAAGPFGPHMSVGLSKAQQARLPGLMQRGYVEKKHSPMSGMTYFITDLGKTAQLAALRERRGR